MESTLRSVFAGAMTSKSSTPLVILVSATARRTESVVTKRTISGVMLTSTPLSTVRLLSVEAATATRFTMSLRLAVGTSTIESI